MVRQEDPEVTSLHGHTEATTTYNVKTHSENNLKISRTDLPLLKKHTETPWRRAGGAEKQLSTKALIWQPTNERIIIGTELLLEVQGPSCLTVGNPYSGDLHGEDESL